MEYFENEQRIKNCSIYFYFYDWSLVSFPLNMYVGIMQYFIENVFIKFVNIQNWNKTSPMKLLFSILVFFQWEQKQISDTNAAKFHQMSLILRSYHVWNLTLRRNKVEESASWIWGDRVTFVFYKTLKVIRFEKRSFCLFSYSYFLKQWRSTVSCCDKVCWNFSSQDELV